MISFLFLMLLYFLPAILGRDKSDATGIFLLNLFLGWTLIGWVAAFIWAIASDRAHYWDPLVRISAALAADLSRSWISPGRPSSSLPQNV